MAQSALWVSLKALFGASPLRATAHTVPATPAGTDAVVNSDIAPVTDFPPITTLPTTPFTKTHHNAHREARTLPNVEKPTLCFDTAERRCEMQPPSSPTSVLENSPQPTREAKLTPSKPAISPNRQFLFWTEATSAPLPFPADLHVRDAELRLEEARMRAFKEVVRAHARANTLHVELQRMRDERAHFLDWASRFAAAQLCAREVARKELTVARTKATDLDARLAHQMAAADVAERNQKALAKAQHDLAKRNLALRAKLRDAQERAEGANRLAGERDDLQRSLANMANLVNAAQTRLLTVERQLADERRASLDGTPTRRPTSLRDRRTLRRQLGSVLRSQSPKKKHIEKELANTVRNLTEEVLDAKTRASKAENQLREFQRGAVYRTVVS